MHENRATPLQMQGPRPKRCPANDTHAVGTRLCTQCVPPRIVQTPCTQCGAWFSAPGIAQHESTCQPAKRQRRDVVPVGEETGGVPLSVVYVQSAKEGESGKFVFARETLFEDIPWLTTHRGKAAGEWWVDAYDILMALLEKRGYVRLVLVVKDRKSLKAHMEAQNTLVEETVDLLVWPNWLFELGKTPEALNEWVERLRQYERVRQCLVFPPIEYALFFARKDVWTHRASLLGLPTIPTHYVYPQHGKWRLGVVDFARAQGTERLVFKRAVGECACQVFCNVVVGERGTLSGLPKALDAFPYLVQPYVDEFDWQPELRLYVVDGVVSWGLESRWIAEDTTVKYETWNESRWPGARAHAISEGGHDTERSWLVVCQ